MASTLDRYSESVTTPPTVRADLGWALSMVSRSYIRASSEALSDVPGGPRGYQVLAAAEEDDPPNQLTLAHQLGLDRTVVTYLIDDLQKAGLVERRPDPVDRRSRRVVRTATGRATLCELERRLSGVEEALLGPLDADEAVALRGMLARLATRVDDGANACTAAEHLMAEPEPTC